jgi:hypothetical protein
MHQSRRPVTQALGKCPGILANMVLYVLRLTLELCGGEAVRLNE